MMIFLNQNKEKERENERKKNEKKKKLKSSLQGGCDDSQHRKIN
jgi:hypothetical protein